MQSLITEVQHCYFSAEDKNEKQYSQSSDRSHSEAKKKKIHLFRIWLLMALEVVRREPGFLSEESRLLRATGSFSKHNFFFWQLHTHKWMCLMKGF